MSGENSTSYAPKSPDLSSIYSAGPTQHQHQQSSPRPLPPQQQPPQHHQLQQQPIAPPPFLLDNSYSPPAAALHRQQPPTTNQQYQPPPPRLSTANNNPYEQQYPQSFNEANPNSATFSPQSGIKSEFPSQPSPISAHDYHSPHQQQPYTQQPVYHQPQHHSGYSYGQQPYGYPGGAAYQPAYGGALPPDPYASHSPAGPGYEMPGTRRAAAAAAAAATSAQMLEEASFPEPKLEELEPAPAPAPAPTASVILEPSPVRTKFPTARIKRIMQADEEVGKVAQQTPIAVGKALELFMIQLVTKSAEVAKEKGSKRVTAPMLKQVVETDDQWDFLREIVGKVENEKEGAKGKPKVESESEEEMVETKKKGKGGRKKKAA